jgi:hypothetical protein
MLLSTFERQHPGSMVERGHRDDGRGPRLNTPRQSARVAPRLHGHGLQRRISPIGEDHLPGDQVRGRRGEEQHEVGDLRRLAEAAERDLGAHRVAHLGIAPHLSPIGVMITVGHTAFDWMLNRAYSWVIALVSALSPFLEDM